MMENKKNLKIGRGLGFEMYEIYTLLACGKCDKAIDELNNVGINYEKKSAASLEFRRFYQQHRDEIKRDDDGMVVLPIIVSEQDGIFQGEEGIEEVLRENANNRIS